MPAAIAQTPSPSLAGTVRDVSGAPVEGAIVHAAVVEAAAAQVAAVQASAARAAAAQADDGAGVTRSAATDAAGRYRFDVLPPGRYTIRAERGGFLPATTTVRISIEPVTADLTLDSLVASESLSVEGSAPTASLDSRTDAASRTRRYTAMPPRPGSSRARPPSSSTIIGSTAIGWR